MALMGADSLKNNLTNPARGYLWEVLIPIPIGDGDNTTYQIRAQSSEIPGRENAPIHIDYKQTGGVDVAGKLKYTHSWACEFIEGEDKKVFDALYSWQQKIVHDFAGIGAGEPLYKTDVYINNLKVDGSTWMRIKLKGAWVSNVSAVTLNYDADVIIRYKVTFNYDMWEDAS